MSALKANLIESQRRMLHRIVAVTGLLPTQLANVVGVSPSTFNKLLQDPPSGNALNATTLAKLFDAVKSHLQSQGRLPSEGANDALQILLGSEIDDPWLRYILIGPPPVRSDDLVEVQVVGPVQAGAWMEAAEWAEEDRFSVTVPLSNKFSRRLRRFAVKQQGSSMNLLYPDGTILVCVYVIDLERGPVPGERVVCHRIAVDGQIEATIKQFDMDAHGKSWLYPRSTDPQHQTPIPLDGSDGAETIQIIGIVEMSCRPE